MFAQQLNQIRINLSITPQGPLAIRSGRTGADPTRAALECVRTTFEGVPTVYIPGSSLKGVMRSHAERLLRSEKVSITDTFSKNAFKQNSPGNEVYSGTCPIGRTFGNLAVKGRLSVTDHLPGGHDSAGSEARQHQIEIANQLEQRNGVAIDRLTGAASGGALFDREAVVQGRFDGHLLLRNVQLYQLALVLFVLRDLDEGWVRIGSGTTRGQGWVRAQIRELTIESRRGRTPTGKLLGYGSLVQGETKDYGLFPEDEIALPQGLASQPRMVWDRLEVPESAVDALGEALVDGPWKAFLERARKDRWSA